MGHTRQVSGIGVLVKRPAVVTTTDCSLRLRRRLLRLLLLLLLLLELKMRLVDHFGFDVAESEEYLVHVAVECQLDLLAKLECEINGNSLDPALDLLDLVIQLSGEKLELTLRLIEFTLVARVLLLGIWISRCARTSRLLHFGQLRTVVVIEDTFIFSLLDCLLQVLDVSADVLRDFEQIVFDPLHPVDLVLGAAELRHHLQKLGLVARSIIESKHGLRHLPVDLYLRGTRLHENLDIRGILLDFHL